MDFSSLRSSGYLPLPDWEGMSENRPAHVSRPYPLNILVADDDAITLRVVSLFLKRQGHTVTTAKNGLESLDLALKKSYDLLITDIDMPEMNGIESVRHIREAGIHLPVIAMTASSPVVRKECFEVGMNGFMTKPLDFNELNRTLQGLSLQKVTLGAHH